SPRSRRDAPWAESSPAAPLRVQEVVEGTADHREGEDDEDDADPGWQEVPPRSEAGGAAGPSRLEERPPRRLEGIAEADEREERLRQDRAGEGQDRVRDDQVDDVRQDMPPHDVAAAGADDPGAVDERPLSEGEGLRADDPGRRRPAG